MSNVQVLHIFENGRHEGQFFCIIPFTIDSWYNILSLARFLDRSACWKNLNEAKFRVGIKFEVSLSVTLGALV